MDFGILSFLAAVQAIALFATTYYSYEIYKHNRLNKVWLAFTAGVALLGIDKLVESFLLPRPDDTQLLTVIVHILFTIGYFLVLGGIRGMKASFDNFEHIEKQTAQKASAFGKKIGRKTK